MASRPDQFIEDFNTYEEREEAFRRAVAFKLARRYAGPSIFWQDFSRIAREGIGADETLQVACIPSNPRDCLAFGSAHQVLRAAAMTAGGREAAAAHAVGETARHFGIGEQLEQPIRTLSGGETVKLALAKSFIHLASCSRLVIASPFAWLSAANRPLLERVVSESKRQRKDLSLMVLAGEEELAPIGAGDPFEAPISGDVSFDLKTTDVRIPLSLSLNPLVSGVHHASVQNTSLRLISPCLMVGDNGQGKSLVARAIAGAVAAKGDIAIYSRHPRTEPPSLLFQDVLSQTLLRSFQTLANGITGAVRDTAAGIYEEMRQAFTAALQDHENTGGMRINPWNAERHSLLDTKTILVAVRLAASPSALILDEPDWGLSRPNAVAFVSAVLAAAHRQKTPLILISHKPWWQPVAKSSIRVSRTGRNRNDAAAGAVFTITLTAGESPH